VTAVLHVWIDQDLCTGDGLCTDHCPEIFTILEDGIAYVRDGMHIGNDPGGSASMVPVADILEKRVIDAADDCPGECIFVEFLEQEGAA
jgi:ferredoxin